MGRAPGSSHGGWLYFPWMQQQETATLNQHVLAESIREGQLKQWWIARQIGVKPRTVSRWLTGKVRQISRDNLTRLAAVLNLEEDLLVQQSSVEHYATQQDQNMAARLLTELHTQQLFIRGQQYSSYESLLKSVLHPNASTADLMRIYSSLMMATAEQGNFEMARYYGQRSTECAEQLGDTTQLLSVRASLCAVDGASGNLEQAIHGLEELYSVLDSLGFPSGGSLALLNLQHASYLRGDLNRSVSCLVPLIEHYVPRMNTSIAVVPLLHSTQVSIDCGDLALASELLECRRHLLAGEEWESERLTMLLLTELLESLRRPAALNPALEQSIAEFMRVGERGETAILWPAVLLRRGGAPGKARLLLEQAAAEERLRVYDPPFVKEELARIAHAEGRESEAAALLQEAAELYSSLGMPRRAERVSLREFSGKFRLPAPHKAILHRLAESYK